eukprot:TRINITY_DN5877_c0_g1_i2.p1 TRINITY_DN5877_c0_g1~~TRINITY_DN5877_c0_g1_i2.p1  ORF type:complete len:498 (-),score=54.27 TRINITY_DN5877_c0_g1_i2:30-1523(-)
MSPPVVAASTKGATGATSQGQAAEETGDGFQDTPFAISGADVPQVREGSYGKITVLGRCASSPKWTISGHGGGGGGADAPSSVPGPGAYDVTTDRRQRVNCVNFGTKPRRSGSACGRPSSAPLTASPGPAYDTRRSNVPRTRGGVIGERCRQSGAVQDTGTPAPADFNPPSTLCEHGVAMAPIGAMTCSRKYKEPEEITILQPKRPSSAPPAWSIGRGKRPPLNSGGGCGAGDTYVPQSTLRQSPAACLRNGNVPNFTRMEVRPDPTTYAVSGSTLSGRGASFGRAVRPSSAPAAKKRDPIGPGSYNPTAGGAAARCDSASSMRSKTRRGAAEEEARAPGPGAYGAPQRLSQSHSAYTIGKSQRPMACAETPSAGPGQYALPPACRFGKGNAVRFPVRVEDLGCTRRLRVARGERTSSGAPGAGLRGLRGSPRLLVQGPTALLEAAFVPTASRWHKVSAPRLYRMMALDRSTRPMARLAERPRGRDRAILHDIVYFV